MTIKNSNYDAYLVDGSGKFITSPIADNNFIIFDNCLLSEILNGYGKIGIQVSSQNDRHFSGGVLTFRRTIPLGYAHIARVIEPEHVYAKELATLLSDAAKHNARIGAPFALLESVKTPNEEQKLKKTISEDFNKTALQKKIDKFGKIAFVAFHYPSGKSEGEMRRLTAPYETVNQMLGKVERCNILIYLEATYACILKISLLFAGIRSQGSAFHLGKCRPDQVLQTFLAWMVEELKEVQLLETLLALTVAGKTPGKPVLKDPALSLDIVSMRNSTWDIFQFNAFQLLAENDPEWIFCTKDTGLANLISRYTSSKANKGTQSEGLLNLFNLSDAKFGQQDGRRRAVESILCEFFAKAKQNSENKSTPDGTPSEFLKRLKEITRNLEQEILQAK